jgi:hypothetical protein
MTLYAVLTSMTKRSSHVQQLIYIALHNISDAAPEKPTKTIYDSPSKLQHFAKTVISSVAVSDARQLLFSLATTQSPDSLARALPSYESTVGVATNATEDIGDSDVAREALCIKEAKDCWSLLAEGFLSKGKVLFSTPKRKGNRRRRGTVDDFTPLDEQVGTSRSIVADSAWPMLDWLLTLFERDERLSKLDENCKFLNEQATCSLTSVKPYTLPFSWPRYLQRATRQLDGTLVHHWL